jgi:hypothetical protein
VTATKSELRFPGAATASAHPVTNAITLAPDALRDWYRGYPYDVRPITDDAPFFWHFVPFRATLSAAIGRRGGATEEGLGERLLLALLVFVTLFAAVALLTPAPAAPRALADDPHKTAAGLYFAALGLGFMFLEVTLIQRLTLFLGYPTYSLTVTLFALLVSTGVGSLLGGGAVARAATDGRPRRRRHGGDGRVLSARPGSAHCTARDGAVRRPRRRRRPGAGAARPLPRRLHAARAALGRRAHAARRGVRRLGVGRERLLLRRGIRAGDASLDDLRVPRRHAAGARDLRRRDPRPARIPVRAQG